MDYPLAFPAIAPISEYLRVVTSQSPQASPYTGAQKVVNNYTSVSLELNMPRMPNSSAEAFCAWWDSLQGAWGTFTYEPIFSVYQNTATLSLNGIAYPSTQIVSVKGWAANAATGLRPGQWVQIGTQLVRLAVCDTDADSSGHATVQFNPPIRSQLADGTAFNTNTPKGLFRLNMTDDSAGSGYQMDVDRVANIPVTIKAVEAIS